MQFVIGNVTSVKGTSVRALILPNLYQTTYIHDGSLYRGISINEFIIIKKGYHNIVGKIEGEEILESKSYSEIKPNMARYDRYIDIKIIGYVDGEHFFPGIKFLPMIQDELFLISDKTIYSIYTFNSKKNVRQILIGKSLLEDIPIYVPINGLFNTHIGIFGNTGSGKSNSLAKIYTELFKKIENKISAVSSFVFIDFNGEYRPLHNQFSKISTYIDLNTHERDGSDKLKLTQSEFWDPELLSVLFSATDKTQKPFLNILIRNKERYGDDIDDYFHETLKVMFGQNQHRETISVLRSIIHIICPKKETEIYGELSQFSWFSKGENNKYFINGIFFNSPNEYLSRTPELKKIDLTGINLSVFEILIVRATLQLIQSVSRNYVQYEHISPLINKMIASAKTLEKVIEIVSGVNLKQKALTFISLKNCNQDTKKMIPMMIAKCSFSEHKKNYSGGHSFHLIIDEAHNILSDVSNRESETWKDYRLELFEEIIKEGRKFGFFVTIASQRPADISTTIISQLHNYFLHRLVNENDLYLLKNTISSLDSSSRSLIPNLPAGACIISGTAFHTPLVIQVERLKESDAPQSDTINLEELW